MVPAVWNTLPRWVVFMSFHMLSVSSGFCYKELFFISFLSVKIVISESPGPCKPRISPCALSVFWWNWHAALPAVEPGVPHSNTALTFSLLLCSSGHNSLTLTFFLSFVSPLVLSYTPLSMIPFISLTLLFLYQSFLSQFVLGQASVSDLTLPHISIWQQVFISVSVPDVCWPCTCYKVLGVTTAFFVDVNP